MPLHTWNPLSGGYGIVSNLYAWSALLFVLLTFGMDTFFRFSNKDGEDERRYLALHCDS